MVKLVGDKTAALVNKAAAAGKVAAALREQEQLARSEGELLAGETKVKSEAARSARDALNRQVAGEQQHSGELTAQLATLKGTTAALEGEYRQGQAALAAYEAAQAAKRAAGEEQARRQAAAAAQQPAAPAAIGANPVQVDPTPANPGPVAPANNPAPAVPDAAAATATATATGAGPAKPARRRRSFRSRWSCQRSGRGEKLRVRTPCCLRMGPGPIPVPGPAVDQGIQLADHRHQRLVRSLRDCPVAAAGQVCQRRQRLADKLPDAGRMGPWLYP
ncbi:hypothetical protein FBY36_3937 [Arthrobacter sp. SLBN-122]|nr:hypothetical protein FBY36_3937 [Arthrobacter sp. SLBN-122]